MRAPRQHTNEHPALDALAPAYPAEDGRDNLSQTLESLQLYYSDPTSGSDALIKTREDFEKSEIFDTLELLYRGDTSLSPPPAMDEIFVGLSQLDRQLEENPNSLAAFPEELQELLLRVANRVRDLQETSKGQFSSPEAEHVKERWDARDKSLKETPLDFVQRVYASFLPLGLSRADVNRIDPKLYRALYNWDARGFSVPPDMFSQVRGRWAGQSVTPEEFEIYKKVDSIRKK